MPEILQPRVLDLLFLSRRLLTRRTIVTLIPFQRPPKIIRPKIQPILRNYLVLNPHLINRVV
jgi:hypothetical protein